MGKLWGRRQAGVRRLRFGRERVGVGEVASLWTKGQGLLGPR